MKRIVVLLMICMLLFSISACSDESASSGSQSSINNGTVTSDVISSVDDDTASSEVSSTRPTISYEGTTLTPPDPTKKPIDPSKNNGPTINIVVTKTDPEMFVVALSVEATAKYKNITPAVLSELFDLDVATVEKVTYFGEGDKKWADVSFKINNFSNEIMGEFYKNLPMNENVLNNKKTN
ncbi:MAG: hypothetical protein IJ462_02630 [Clostridia bacterium]|nr:hypothetical protein [Clostridia bacterium]